ncbi:MAG: hypothetical protein WD894_25020 [Pirellulales bacterium]
MHALRWFSIAVLFALFAGCGSVVAIPSTPDGTVQAVTSELANDRPQVVWRALPASYQTDIREVIVAFADKMDADLWNRTFAVLGKISRVAKEKKEFILATIGDSPIEQLDEEKLEKLNENWDRVVAIFETIVASDIKTVEGLKTLNPEKFLATTGSRLSQNFKDLATAVADQETAETFAQLGQTKVTVVTSEGDNATLSIEAPDQPAKTVEMVRFEGKWLPAEMVANWDTGVAQVKQSISQMDFAGPSREMFLGVIGQFEQTLDQLLAANSQAEFDQAAAGLTAMFGGLMTAKFGETEEFVPATPDVSFSDEN